MSDADLPTMLDLAVHLARQAARLTRARGAAAPLARKADDSMVTQTDHDVQELVLAGIAAGAPGHAVLAEETTPAVRRLPTPTAARYCWVIDPIDGTRNLITGFPCLATSIALLDAGRPVVAAVIEHHQGTIFSAVAGRGTTAADQPVRVRQPPPREDWLLGGPSTKEPLTRGILERIIHAPDLIYRNVGSSAIHLAWVAAGALAAAFAKRCKIWDIAAGALLVTEAGGLITGLKGQTLTPFDLARDPDEDIPFVAGPPQAHARLLELAAFCP